MSNPIPESQNFTNPATFSWRGRIGRQRFLATLLIANIGGGILGALLLESGEIGALLAVVLLVYAAAARARFARMLYEIFRRDRHFLAWLKCLGGYPQKLLGLPLDPTAFPRRGATTPVNAWPTRR